MKKILIILFILSICFISATHSSSISTGASSYSKKQGQISTYNISIHNEETTSNITKVEIILPLSFTFEISSQGTTALSTDFSKEDSELTWQDTENFLIDAGETKYFWFEASAKEVGDFELTIKTFNETKSDQSKISVKITECIADWSCSKWSTCNNSIKTRKCFDLNECNNQSEKPPENQSCIISCNPDWTCTQWSECTKDNKTRTCIDLNNCNTTNEKPKETNQCFSFCTPDWDCTKWSKCINSTQTRTCTDINNCNRTIEKSLIKQNCSKKKISWKFTIIVITLIIIISLIIIYLIKKIKNIK